MWIMCQLCRGWTYLLPEINQHRCSLWWRFVSHFKMEMLNSKKAVEDLQSIERWKSRWRSENKSQHSLHQLRNDTNNSVHNTSICLWTYIKEARVSRDRVSRDLVLNGEDDTQSRPDLQTNSHNQIHPHGHGEKVVPLRNPSHPCRPEQVHPSEGPGEPCQNTNTLYTSRMQMAEGLSANTLAVDNKANSQLEWLLASRVPEK